MYETHLLETRDNELTVVEYDGGFDLSNEHYPDGLWLPTDLARLLCELLIEKLGR